MGLFDKKYCDICGEKIGLLGNRKLEDGNLCKDCAKKLSPWFSDRRRSTVEDIKGQLAYREENREKVAQFRTTRSFGEDWKVLIDEEHRWFTVTRARDLAEANPDILDFDAITGCRMDIDESRTELTREDADGKDVSYVPPRYEYSYDFFLVISVRHPYFDEMRFSLNSSSVYYEPQKLPQRAPMSHAPMDRPSGRPKMINASRVDPEDCAEYRKYLDTVKAEAAEADKVSTANTKMKDFAVTVTQFAHDDVAVKITTKIPESGWSYDEGKKCLVENDDPTAFGAGAIRFEVRANVEDFDYYKDKFENYQDIDDRVIGGITFKGRTYKYIGYDWIEYVAQIDDGRALSIGLTKLDCVPGTMPDVILSGMTIK